jgi:hypothetical protein
MYVHHLKLTSEQYNHAHFKADLEQTFLQRAQQAVSDGEDKPGVQTRCSAGGLSVCRGTCSAAEPHASIVPGACTLARCHRESEVHDLRGEDEDSVWVWQGHLQFGRWRDMLGMAFGGCRLREDCRSGRAVATWQERAHVTVKHDCRGCCGCVVLERIWLFPQSNVTWCSVVGHSGSAAAS